MLKRCFAALLTLVMLIPCAGCGIIFAARDAYEDYEQDQNVIYVAFSKDGEENDPMDYTEIADYQSKYSKYNSRVMYQTLTPAEQQIYRFYEYALDHEYTSMFFDSRLLEDLTLSLEEILRLYSMDSPLVQQNYSYSSQISGYTFSYLQEMFQFEVTGAAFYIDNFSHEAMEKKKEAIAEAEKIFASMPENLSQLEQARFFFRRIIGEVKYSLTETSVAEQNNLYDAFLLKQTQCDGFANAFSLLCSMANIPCVEKIVTAKEEGEIGHTWNAFCADGIWYNADLALDEEYANQHKEMDVDFNFGFSDARIEEAPDFAERFAPCTTDLLPVELTLTSASDENLIKSLKELFKAENKRFVLLSLDEGELVQDDLQKIANGLKSDIQTYTQTWGGKVHYYIFKV